VKVCDYSKGSPESIDNTTMCCMAMGTRQSAQGSLWVATAELPKSPGHPFYTRLNAADFDRFVEGQCARFYAPKMGRPSLVPGRYFRLLLVGYFEAGLRGDVTARYVRNRTRV
jgi:hypothetical protein